MKLLHEFLQLNEAKMREDGIYKHSSGMCEVHVDASDPDEGVRARVMFKSVDHDDEEQLEISRKKYLPFVRQVLDLYNLDVEDAHTHDPEDDDGYTVIYLEFPNEAI